ncbi:LuxR C-terminal-related transcriptional regulator (plasmid) [Novosphingobium sp. BL-8A]|uniref:response regulator transcription factor n=1 Tax=Novosphingobium sp. BL-8A TaxID=3127639 RepID=UPI0037576629
MPDDLTVVLIDSNQKRHISMARLLHKAGIEVERADFRGQSELARSLILIANDEEEILNRMLTLAAGDPRISLIVYAEQVDVRKIVNVISRGAVDYLLIPAPPPELEATLKAARKRAVLAIPAQHRVIRAAERINRLSKREREVLLRIARGQSNRLIGNELSISPRTVEVHRANMMFKLGAKNMSEAIRIAIDAGEA